MSIHISAEVGQIAPTVLLPGDPLRAKFIAETYLQDPICYNNVRGMLGFTGTYKGKKVSVQGTGMGVPSVSIYTNELISSYGAKNLIRVGTCGAMQANLNLSDVVLAQAACTDSSMNKIRFNNLDFSPIADFKMLKKAYEVAQAKSLSVSVGNVFTTDTFYGDVCDAWKLWAKFNVLVIEMETAALYTLAAKFSVKALSILTISDSMITGEQTTAEEREKNFTNMIEIALEAAED